MKNIEAPFSEMVALRLLNPGLTEGLSFRGIVLDQWVVAYGVDGERAAATWQEHEQWLRWYARRYEIAPIYAGMFFIEAIADARTKGTL